MTKQLAFIAALVFAIGTVHQAVACDMGAITAYVASTVVACSSDGCTAEPPVRQPAECARSSGCVTPERAPPKVACQGDNCAIDEPTPAPAIGADCGASGC